MKLFLMLFSVFCFAFIVSAELEEFGNDEAEKEAYKKCLKEALTPNGISPFEYALWSKNIKLIKGMIEHGVKVEKNAIVCFSFSADDKDFNVKNAMQIIELLLKNGASIDAASYPDGRGPTAMTNFAFYGKLRMIKFMLDKGADINGANSCRSTPLAYACATLGRDANLEIVKYLIKNGADVNKMGRKEKTTPLMIAAGRSVGATEKELKNISFVIDLLLEHGADPFVKDQDGHTALDLLYFYSKGTDYPVPPEIEKKLKKAMEKKK